MDKNTVWAIVLSILVIIGSFLLMPKWFGSKGQDAGQPVAAEQQAESNENQMKDLGNEGAILEAAAEETAEEVQIIPEQTITVTTEKANIVLTNKGADIISYELIEKDEKGNLKNFDIDTGKGVQLADSISAKNRACAVSFGNATSETINDTFEVKKLNDLTYLFTKEMKIGGKKFTFGKQYTFTKDEYMFKLDILLHDETGTGLDFGGTAYSLRTAPQIGPHYDPKKDRYEKREFLVYNGKKVKSNMIENGKLKYYDKDVVWSGIAGKYFLNLIVPADNTIISNAAYSGIIEVNDYANAQAIMERRAFTGKDVQDTYYMYFGPRDEKNIEIYNISDENAFKLSGKKLTMSLPSSWLNWLENILKFGLQLLHKIVPNWGVCIILLTLIIKIILFPLSKKQSLGSLKMQEIQPKMNALKEKYKDNQPKLQEEMQKLYKQADYNPASGCLPILLQFLLVMAMFYLFNNYFEFRGASFIKGWVSDLSVGDSVYSIKKEIPFITTFLHMTDIRLLPVLYLISQLVSGVITQNNGMSAGQSKGQMKLMMYGLPIFFFFILYNAPSGLILYWLTSNVLGVIQQVVINKLVKEKKAEKAVVKPVSKRK
jgi:YidC/Oxa1 family membrane protein insertase